MSRIAAGELAKVQSALHSAWGVSLADYTGAYLTRRIETRLRELKLASVAQYLPRLLDSRDEASRLLERLSVTVTEFFRDPYLFEAVARHVVPGLAAVRPFRDAISAWSAGCATGQEAYSLAMALDQAIAAAGLSMDFNVVGTDINAHSIAAAQAGRYTRKEIESISARCRQAYLRYHGDRATFVDRIRSRVSFLKHDLVTSGAPGGPKDVIICRNILLYMSMETRLTVLDKLRDALAPGGFLILGPSETSLDWNGLQPVDPSGYILRKPAAPAAAPAPAQPRTVVVLAVVADRKDHAAVRTIVRSLQPNDSSSAAIVFQRHDTGQTPLLINALSCVSPWPVKGAQTVDRLSPSSLFVLPAGSRSWGDLVHQSLDDLSAEFRDRLICIATQGAKKSLGKRLEIIKRRGGALLTAPSAGEIESGFLAQIQGLMAVRVSRRPRT